MKNPMSSDLLRMIAFVRNCGVDVNTNTLARGHQGFFMNKRIDISSVLTDERKKEVLVHEFAHYIHSLIEPDVIRNHGSLSKLFKIDNTSEIESELLKATRISDSSSALDRLFSQKKIQLDKIKEIAARIKEEYPDFRRSYPYKKFESQLKKTEAKYLLKYDRVKIRTPFLRRIKVYSVSDFKNDFPHFEQAIGDYILLKSHQRMLRRISSRIGRLNRYYKRPSELFARFVEGLYKHEEIVKDIAPAAYIRFMNLLECGYYGKMSDFIGEFFQQPKVLCVS